MKIAWFSPLPPEHSDIANFTERLRGELQKRFEPRFLTEKGEGFLDPATGAFYHAGLGPCPYELLVSLNSGDLPIYNLGNNPLYFAQTWFLNQYKPGVVILHDVKMHHFFEGVYRERLRDENRYVNALKEEHGARGQQAGIAFNQSRVTIDFMAEHYPMTAWAMRNALAVVTHTPHACEAVRRVTSAPVSMIPLPYEPREISNLPSRQRRAFSPEEPAKLVIFGFLGTNRRIVEFLHALAWLQERDCFEVHLIGTLQHAAEVHVAVNILGLRGRVFFHGYVSDQRLETLLDEADLAINLRYPSMGEASGSQLRIWDHALPSLVTECEGYATLPPDTVFFVRQEHERTDIQRHLRHLLRRPGYFREKGRRGREWLLAHHRPAIYAGALRTFCEDADAWRARHNRLRLAERVGRNSASWAAGLSSDDHARRYAARMAEII